MTGGRSRFKEVPQFASSGPPLEKTSLPRKEEEASPVPLTLEPTTRRRPMAPPPSPVRTTTKTPPKTGVMPPTFQLDPRVGRRDKLAQMMKGRHQFRRRFSLQPSTLKEGQEDGTTKNARNDRLSESDSGDGKSTESSVRHKIVVMGAAKVGKSAIINQFLYNVFTPKYRRTVEEMHHGDFNVAGIHLTLDILDTSGSYEFPAMRDLSIKSADAFILVYDVNDASTFDEVKALRGQILSTKGAVPIVIVGNKVDLVDLERKVDTQSTRELVTTKWENGFVEVSAKENVNISQVFQELLIQAKLKYNLSPALRRRRRQSLPPPQHLNSRSSSAHVPSPAQLQHLQQIRERSESKRNSCIIS